MSTKKALKSIQTKLGRGDQEDALSEATQLLKELKETSPEMSQVYVDGCSPSSQCLDETYIQVDVPRTSFDASEA
jgi:hypothetical protein